MYLGSLHTSSEFWPGSMNLFLDLDTFFSFFSFFFLFFFSSLVLFASATVLTGKQTLVYEVVC